MTAHKRGGDGVTRRTILWASAGALALSSHPAGAQGFERDRNVSVQERMQARMLAEPVRAGAFNLWPRIAGGVLFNDNIRAVGFNEDSDVILTINPTLRVQSDWSRHVVRADAFVISRTFLDNDEENHIDWGGDGELELNFAGPFDVSFTGRYAQLHEVRTSPSAPTAAREPVNFDDAGLGARVTRTFNRVRAEAGVELGWIDFDDVASFAGPVIEQDDRDRRIFSYFARADYAVSPSLSVFARAAGNDRDYDVEGLTSRDSDGYDVRIGADFDIGALARGEASIGYVSQDYDSPLFDNVSGLGVNARVEYFPTPLTTFSFNGRIAAEETSIAAATGYISQSANLRVDHELLRNLVLFARAGVDFDEYETIDRNDQRWGVGLGAVYQVNRQVGVALDYDFFRQDSSGVSAADDFDVNALSVRVIFRPG